MSITLKSPREIEAMRAAGRIVANALQQVRGSVRPGVTTREIERIADREIRSQGGEPAFPYINNFPGAACVSVNEAVVHGLPSKRELRAGDIVKIDIGAIYHGYHGDAAITVPVGAVSEEARRLIDVTEEALVRGILAARAGAFLNDIGAAIEDYVAPTGFSIVRQYVGHGLGRELHEPPNVAHYRQVSRGVRLRPGMVLTIEPMINAGTYETRILSDDWTVVTADGRLSAQFEHTIAITDNGSDILTIGDRGETWSLPFSGAKEVQY
jgi:methionyl aminopeptidase